MRKITVDDICEITAQRAYEALRSELPSAADLDAIAEEERVRQATREKAQGSA